jgi:Ca2+:H+ antiporter
MSVISVLIPSAFHFSITTSPDGADNTITSNEEKNDILSMSHGVAIILLMLYIGYLLFQLFTHADLYVDEEGPTKSTKYPDEVANYPSQLREKVRFSNINLRKKNTASSENDSADSPTIVDGGIAHAIAHVHGTSSAIERRPGMRVDKEGRVLSWGPGGVPEGAQDLDLERARMEEDEEEEEPEMSWITALIAMVIVTVLVGVTAEFVSRSAPSRCQ